MTGVRQCFKEQQRDWMHKKIAITFIFVIFFVSWYIKSGMTLALRGFPQAVFEMVLELMAGLAKCNGNDLRNMMNFAASEEIAIILFVIFFCHGASNLN